MNIKADPVTTLIIIKTGIEIADGVVSIANGLKDFFSSGSDPKVYEALKAMNRKLDKLLEGQAQIYTAIIDLRYTIREEIQRQEFDNLHRNLQSWILTLNLNIAQAVGSSAHDEREAAISQIKSLLFGSAGQQLFLPTLWGAGAFNSAAIGYAAWLQTSLIVNASKEYIKIGLNKFEDFFKTSLRQTDDLIDDVEDNIKRIESQIKSRIDNRKIKIGENTVDDDSNYDVCYGENVTKIYLNIEGDLSTGFTGRRSTERGKWTLRCRNIVVPHSNDEFQFEKVDRDVESFFSGKEILGFDYNGIIQDLNSKRSSYHKLVSQYEQLVVLKAELEKLLRTFPEIQRKLGFEEDDTTGNSMSSE